MKVLMISQDDSVFPGSRQSSNTLLRLRAYLGALNQLEPGSSLTDLIFTREDYQEFQPCPGLHLVPVKSARIQFFPISGLIAAMRIRRVMVMARSDGSRGKGGMRWSLDAAELPAPRSTLRGEKIFGESFTARTVLY